MRWMKRIVCTLMLVVGMMLSFSTTAFADDVGDTGGMSLHCLRCSGGGETAPV